MSYPRVIPRDLFNESKLLKCLGRLSLLILEGVGVPPDLTLVHDIEAQDGFAIEQDANDAAIYCINLECFCRGRLIGLRCPYNSKEAFPLLFVFGDTEGRVFDDAGNLSDEFLQLTREIAA